MYAVMMTNPDEQHYLGNLELDGQRKTASNIVSALDDLVGEKYNFIKAIATDNENTMLCVRESICAKYPKIINIRCILHTLNLVCQDVLKHQAVKSIVKEINALVVFFSNSYYWQSKLAEWGKNRGITSFLTTHCETRWYSFIEMAMKAFEFCDGFTSCFSLYLSDKKKHSEIFSIRNIVNDTDMSVSLKHLITILKPISDAIAIMEQKDASIGDVWPGFLVINNYLNKYLDPEKLPAKYMELGTFAKERLNYRAKHFETDVGIRFKMFLDFI